MQKPLHSAGPHLDLRGRRINPPDIAVPAAVNHVDSAMGGVLEHNRRLFGKVELHHSRANGHLPQGREALSHNDRVRIPLGGVVRILLVTERL